MRAIPRSHLTRHIETTAARLRSGEADGRPRCLFVHVVRLTTASWTELRTKAGGHTFLDTGNRWSRFFTFLTLCNKTFVPGGSAEVALLRVLMSFL